MKLVHPQDLKIGDVVRYVNTRSWISPEFTDTNIYGTLDCLYKVQEIKITTKRHMTGVEGLNNPLVVSIDGSLRNFSAWYGSWVIVNRKIKKPVKEFGIVGFCRRYYK
jgi:hypothetical protein